MSKAFDILYATDDPLSGSPLEWEWDHEAMVFVAYDSNGREYHLQPIMGEIEMIEAESEADEGDVEDGGEE